MSINVEDVPDGWYQQLADECRANGIEVEANDFGMPVSVHRCSTCGDRYTVCPPSPNEGPDCCVDGCDSYDPSHDASILFLPDDQGLIEP